MVEEITTYAPIMIPTLCRYEHLKSCLESLMLCVWAEKTEVYIALDYPVQKCHREGYFKIDLYLQNIKNSHPFKKLHIIKRARNYGLGVGGNGDTMRQELIKLYDRLIFSEDDNIFSPNFLVYMNKGLELFKEDKSVLAINGYRHFYNIKYDNNTFFRQNVDFSAWGYGIWRDRIEQYSQLNHKWFAERLSLRTLLSLRKTNGNNRAMNFLSLAVKSSNQFSINDNVLSVYMALKNLNVIMPTVSLVRNMGVDGSGENFKKVRRGISEKHSQQIISLSLDFEYIGTGYEYYDYNREVYKFESYGNYSNLLMIEKFFKHLIRYSFTKLKIAINKQNG